MGAFNRHKGELVGIANGEFSRRLSLEFTLGVAVATLSSRNNKLNGLLRPYALRATSP